MSIEGNLLGKRRISFVFKNFKIYADKSFNECL